MKTYLISRSLYILLAFVCLFPLLDQPVEAGGIWRVVPIRLDFDQQTKSGVITLHNDGDSAVNLQMKAFVWKQDSQGKDVYEETEDLVFFPKVLTLPARESRIIRSGIKIPATTGEKTYRLFIEEIPEPRKGNETVVSISLRFGVPIFVSPLKPEMKGSVSQLVLKPGHIDALLKNAGNVHFRILSLELIGRNSLGAEVWRQKQEGWYLISGAQRSYQLAFPAVCKEAATLELLVLTDKGSFSATASHDPSLCPP